MALATGHGDSLGVTEELVDGNGMVEGSPALAQVSGAARDEKRARRHERVQFHEVVSAFDQHLVSAGTLLAFGRKFAEGASVFGIGHIARFKAQIPHIPVVDAATWV